MGNDEQAKERERERERIKQEGYFFVNIIYFLIIAELMFFASHI